MSIREMLMRDFGISVRTADASGKRDDPYVLEACGAEEAAMSQYNLLRGLSLALGSHWRIVEWTASDDGTATEVIRIEEVEFSEREVWTTPKSFYFDTRAVSGSPYSLQPLTAWRGPPGTPVLPLELGWLHFDRVIENTNSSYEFDQTINYSSPGAKAGVYVYSSPKAEAADAPRNELSSTIAIMLQMNPKLQDTGPLEQLGPFVLKTLVSGENVTVAGIAVSGGYFIKVRLTYIRDERIHEMMGTTLNALATCVLQNVMSRAQPDSEPSALSSVEGGNIREGGADHPTINNTIFNNGVMDIMGLLRIRLPGDGWWWHTSDYEEGQSKGAVFTTIDDQSREVVARIIVVDASLDPDEPNVSQFDHAEAAAFDEWLQREAEVKCAAHNIELIEWSPSVLNEGEEHKAFVSVYYWRAGQQLWKHFYARMTVEGRKVIIGFSFDIRWDARIGRLLLNCVRDVGVISKGRLN